MSSATASNYNRQELLGRNEPDFVTVVSVGNNQQTLNIDNFVTVLSIGTGDKKNDSSCDKMTSGTSVNNNLDVNPEEEVEVFRLPGEPLGFGLKFEGGAKNAERVKRLFVQSCAEQSPASRAKCSWGSIGEGDEVLSIDGVPVTHMSRLDCVRRLKESQLVIKLLVRCRGALRPEVVSAELKLSHEIVEKCEKKIPPELPSVPPPVPPRKLRHARGSGDGEANPIPAKKTSWNVGPTTSGSSSSSSSQTDSPPSKKSSQLVVATTINGKSTTNDEITSTNSPRGSPNESFKRSINERSPEFAKSKQEPPEAMVYLDARSQDSSSTHGSTSDDTGSSMSTVVDRFSMSDRFSTVSTTSTTSGGGIDQNGSNDRTTDENFDDRPIDSRDVTRLSTFQQLEQDFFTDSSEYLLKRLANSEAVTHVESRGEAGGFVEKITTVVAPNTIIIEETLTLQPPLSFQDAPLSYGHETRPGLVYNADLAADSTTHFRPIRDEASIVECVNDETPSSCKNYESNVCQLVPILPARNHVNRIPVNQQKDSSMFSLKIDRETHHSREVPLPRESIVRDAPILPPKPMPRKDVKLKRKRPPPPPPPPPRVREPPPPIPTRTQPEVTMIHDDSKVSTVMRKDSGELEETRHDDLTLLSNGENSENSWINESQESLTNKSDDCEFSPLESPSLKSDGTSRINKVLEIIEMKKNKALGETIGRITESRSSRGMENFGIDEAEKCEIFAIPAPREKRKILDRPRNDTISMDIEDSEESSSLDIWQEANEQRDSDEIITNNSRLTNEADNSNVEAREDASIEKEFVGSNDENKRNDEVQDEDEEDDDDDETYRSLDEIKEDFKSTETNGTLSESEDDNDDDDDNANEQASGNAEGEDSTSDDSEDNGDDYYWQSNLATIGEEEETSSLEYTNANKDSNNSEDKSSCPRLELKTDTTRGCTSEISETMKNSTIGDATKLDSVRRINKETASTLDNKLDTRVNGRMENCGGDQRLPPDGDEFPATYQEFSACTSEQYQYVGTSTRLTPRNNNNNNNNNNNDSRTITENLANNDNDETLSMCSAATSTTSSKKLMKNFNEKLANDSIKSLRIESTTKKNLICNNNNNNVISTFRESRDKSLSYVKTKNIKNPQIDNNLSCQYVKNSSINKRDNLVKSEISERDEFIEDEKNIKTIKTYANCSTTKISENPALVVTEKTFEITNYRPKDTKLLNYEIISSPREAKNVYDKRENSFETNKLYEKIVDKDYLENLSSSPPPPLPLVGPPKIESHSTIASSKCTEKLPEINVYRKYSLNSDSRRQDDKSEKSVRDKIAMFSSQSSLETPLFPGQTFSTIASVVSTPIMSAGNARKLSKYKSSDDVFNDDEANNEKREYAKIERTQSYVDLTDCEKYLINEKNNRDDKFKRPPSLPKTLPPDETSLSSSTTIRRSGTIQLTPEIKQKSIFNATIIDDRVVVESANEESSNSTFDDSSVSMKKIKISSPPILNDNNFIATVEKISNPMDTSRNNSRTAQSSLTRATSFSGESNFSNDSSLSSANFTISPNGQISRTNSLASTFRRNSEDMRRQSLNQLIEQRRKGISKLRGLVIPEKNTVPIDKPIIDLPEIKSRDSILLHQLPRATIQDKWGSQSSIASTASTSSLPMKATTTFKMPEPQIMSKYSPAFKRKSLAVYATTACCNSSSSKPTTTSKRAIPMERSYTGITQESSPKSLDSLCSPTRSECSFDFVTSSTSISPVSIVRNRARPLQRKFPTTDYEDSDNDSALSSSQSSISRGFSPPTSPLPSERSSLTSDRSYHTSLIMDLPAARNYSLKDTTTSLTRRNDGKICENSSRQLPIIYNEHLYSNSDISSSCSSNCSTPNPCSPVPEVITKNSQIPQRQGLKRSSSTETNCSSESSSTLTSGSQASAESLSRRVLKPQSVEAINRKNILASARCRSGRDLNGGSPLIQRKFSDDEELPISSLAKENFSDSSIRRNNETLNLIDRQNVKIAYIEVTENFEEEDQQKQQQQYVETRDKKMTEKLENCVVDVSSLSDNNTIRSDLLEASNDLKMWVRSEAKALMMAEMPARENVEKIKKVASTFDTTSALRKIRSESTIVRDDEKSFLITKALNDRVENNEIKESIENYKTRDSKNITNDGENLKKIDDTINENILTKLSTKSRSRAPLNIEDRYDDRFSRKINSLEDILIGKRNEEKFSLNVCSSSNNDYSSKNNLTTTSRIDKFSSATLPRSKNNLRSSLADRALNMEEKMFISKIPMPEKFSRSIDNVDNSIDSGRNNERSRISKIPMQRNLGRRSASVTDMKKAIDKTDLSENTSILADSIDEQSMIVKHQRFSSLDSSVEKRDERIVSCGTNAMEIERFNGEQFGSISSLASSTSLISQQELAQLVEDANCHDDTRNGNHDVVVVILHKENPHGSVGITLAGGTDCETKEITVHRVLGHSIADKDGRLQRGDRITSINGRSTRGLSHRESLTVLKQPRSEIVLVVSRMKNDESSLVGSSKLRSRTESVETIVEGSEICGTFDETAWGPATRVTIFKDGAGLGFSLAGGRDSPLGDRPLVIKKIFTGGAAEKTASLMAGDQLIEVNGIDVTRMARIEAWSLMKKLSDGEANLLVRHPATKSS